MDPDFWLFAAVGFAAQLVDGALGMAYGVISTSVLLSFGVSPASASATVHAAKVFTGAASGISRAAPSSALTASARHRASCSCWARAPALRLHESAQGAARCHLFPQLRGNQPHGIRRRC